MVDSPVQVDRSPIKPSWLNRIQSGWLGLVIQRILQAIPVLLVISILSFLLLKLAPGDFLDSLKLDPSIGQGFIDQERIRLGLDKPWIQQYFIWLGNLLRGDFGLSYTHKVPVLTLVVQRAGATLLLAISSVIMTWVIALPMGILGAIRQHTSLDRGLQIVSYVGQAMPSFILAILLLIFAQSVGWLPVGGMTSINFSDYSWWGKLMDLGWHLLLPTLALSITGFAGLQRITRGSFLDVLRQEYIQSARARGLPEWRVLMIHAFRNAINPLITILGFEFASLLSGSFVAEFFFNWPGLGKLLLEAVQSFDINVVMAGLLFGSLMLMIGNLLADLLLQAVDPRIRLEALE